MATVRPFKPVSLGISRQHYFSSCRPGLVCRALNGKRTDPSRNPRRKEVSSSFEFDVYATSDLHTDYPDNFEWVENLCGEKYQNDVLLVAGDISDDLRIIRKTLASLVSKFKHVAFVPGNHELWVRGAAKDATVRNENATNSMDKLAAVLDACDDLGVIIHPQKIGNLWVVPILSWHHKSFDTEPGIPDVPRASKLTISDYRCCKWAETGSEEPPLGSKSIATHLDSLNDDSWIQAAEGCDVITFSHFLPRQELLPEKRFLYYPNVAKAIGSVPLRKRLKRINPNIHVFGHSHFGWDSTLDDGVRYVQCPLCYPGERTARARSIALLSPLDRFAGQWGGQANGVKEAEWLPAVIYSSQDNSRTQVNGAATREGVKKDESDSELAESISSTQPNAASSGSMESPQSVNGRDSGDVGFSGRPRLPAWDDWLSGERDRQLGSLDVKSLHRGAMVNGARPVKGARPLNGVMHTWHAAWSDYYKTRKRDPSNKELASWVSERWRQKTMRRNEKKRRKEQKRTVEKNGKLK
ncbi:hypothetical protein BSKO_06541 [Bryopsis sp. KO-2023]|nr:hypothetical protein BSKO_06541 [Bryopsis sp. KO-2023]